MSQVTLTTTTATPPLMVPTFVGQTSSHQHDVVLPPKLIPRDMMIGYDVLTTMLWWQQPQSQMSSQTYAIYAMGHLQASFSFKNEPLTNSLWYVLVGCYGVCFLLSDSHVTTVFTSGGSTIGVCDIPSFQSIPLVGICASDDGPWPMSGVHWVAAPPAASSREIFMLLIQLSPSHPIHTVWHIALRAWQRVMQSLCLSPLPTKTRLWGLLLSSQTPLTCQIWMHLLMKVMPCPFQSLQTFCPWFILFLIHLDHSLLLVLNLTDYGARLGLCFCLSCWQVKCQLLSWFATF